MENLYYTAPSEAIFIEVKAQAIMLWRSYSDEHGYASDKIKRIDDIENVSDNLMYMVAMFDTSNQNKLADQLSEEARLAIRERLEAGGSPAEYINF